MNQFAIYLIIFPFTVIKFAILQIVSRKTGIMGDRSS